MKKVLAVIVGALICFTGCGKKDEQVIRIGYNASLSASQLFVGVAKGYFKEEGINVEVVEFSNGHEVMTALRGKSLDIGFSIVPTLLASRAGGLNVKSIGAAAFNDGNVQAFRIILPTDSEVQSAQDLRGKKIAVITEGSPDYFMLLKYLERNGIKKEEVNIVMVPYPDMILALTSKSIDAAAAGEPFVTMGTLDNRTKELEHFYPEEEVDIITAVALEEFIDENAEMIERFSRAIDKATNYINNEPEEFRKLLANLEDYGIKFKISKEVADAFRIPGFRSVLTAKSVEPIMNSQLESNILKTRINMEDIIYSPNR